MMLLHTPGSIPVSLPIHSISDLFYYMTPWYISVSIMICGAAAEVS